MDAAGERGRTDRESGFGLVEVIVSMVLLGVVAMAFLPLVVRATSAAANGTTLTTATRLVSHELEVLRAAPVDQCPAAVPKAPYVVTDARGVDLEVTSRSERCEGGVATYTVVVTRTSPSTTELARGTTVVAVRTW